YFYCHLPPPGLCALTLHAALPISPHAARVLIVRQLLVKRVSAPLAAVAFDDLTPAPPPKEERAIFARRDRGAGRPTKRERRDIRSEEHTSELQSRENLVCRLLLEK